MPSGCGSLRIASKARISTRQVFKTWNSLSKKREEEMFGPEPSPQNRDGMCSVWGQQKSVLLPLSSIHPPAWPRFVVVGSGEKRIDARKNGITPTQ